MQNRPLPEGAKRYSEKGKKVFSGIRFDIYQWEQEQFDGSKAIYEIVKREDSVIILPIIGDEFVIVKELQPHWEKPEHVIIAGGIHDDEELIDGAKRELEEETGMVFKNYYLVNVTMPVPGVEWFLYFFIAKDLVETKEKRLDAGEKIETVKVSFERLIEMTKNQEFKYRPKFIEDHLVTDKIEELKDKFKNPEKYLIQSSIL